MPKPRLKVVPDAVVTPSVTPAFQPWKGGRYREVDGVRYWYIRRRLGDGVRREFSLGPISEGDAHAELALFNRDMEAYRTPKERATQALQNSGRGAVRLDEATMRAFLKRCKALVDRDEMTEKHMRGTLSPYLTQWGEKLKGRDLHIVRLDDLQAALRTWTTAHHKRIVALKAFTAWARTEKEAPKLRRAEDPTIDLSTPAIVAEKKRRKKGYSIAFVEKFYAHVPSQVVRDMLRLRACAHGMHDTEIDRLAQGKGELVKVKDPSGIYGLLVFKHKKKRQDHAIPVDRATYEAAERMQDRGGAMAKSAMLDILDGVAMKLHGCEGVSRVVGTRKSGIDKRDGRERAGEVDTRIEPCGKCNRLLPSELRHSFATWGSTVGELVRAKGQKGVSLDLVAEAMGHLNKGTTKGFYVGDHIPPMIKIPINLKHVDDP